MINPRLPVVAAVSPGRGQAAAPLCTAVTLVAICLAAAPFVKTPLGAAPSFLPAFGATMFLTDLLTAALLFCQARIARDLRLVRLGGAYLFSAAAIVPHLLAFPNLFGVDPVIGTSSSAVWLWCAWHGGFAIGVLCYAVSPPETMRDRDIVLAVAGIVALVGALALLATAGQGWLPVILQGNSFGRLNSLGIGPVILGLTVTAGLLVVRKPSHTALSNWLAVAMLAASLDASLTLFGAGRYTVGWYIARMLSITTGVTVLIALLSELISQAARAVRANEQLEHLLGIDVLTEVANRRAFEQALQNEWRRARREESALSLVMIDIDVFKGFNDHYGHGAGDTCLRAVAGVFREQMQRPGDFAARLGGEEFVLLLPNTEERGALDVAERVREAVAGLGIPHAVSQRGHVTISLGVATCHPHDATITATMALEAADSALYRAKTNGRNRVCLHSEAEPALV